MPINELTAKIRELKTLQALIEQATAEAETIKDALKVHMGDNEELTVDVYKVRYQTVKSKRFDTTAFKNENPDAYNRYSVDSISRRFTVA